MPTSDLERVVVTGGAGFIGSWTVKRLAEEGLEVTVVDNMHTARMLDLVQGLGVEILRVDVRDYEGLVDSFNGTDAVFHLAGVISVEESAENPLLYHQVNGTGTLNVLRAAKEVGAMRVVYSSSAAVYGEPVSVPVSEEHPTRPTSVYGASKLSGETYCSAFHHTYGLSVVTLRFFNVYGEGQSKEYAGAITSFIRRMESGKPPIIHGDGLQTRDFVYAEDVAQASLLALKSPSIEYGVFNVGSGTPTRIVDLAETLLRLAESNLRPLYVEPRKGDIRHSVADISAARRALGYEPEYSLEEGLRDILNRLKRGRKAHS